MMYVVLKYEEIGGFGGGWYWSSSLGRAEAMGTGGWAQNFSNGEQESRVYSGGSGKAGDKKNTHSVRAVRQF